MKKFPYTYRPAPGWTRRTDEDLLGFIHYFYPDGREFPHDNWKRLEWTLSKIDHNRRVEFLPLSRETNFAGTVVDCLGIDARGGRYSMSEVTGVDHEVIKSVLKSGQITAILREAVELIETYGIESLGFRCIGGTHRSVAVIHILLMIAYRNAVCRPLNERVRRAAEHFWRMSPLPSE